jgi:glycosyltransferase involved in cell wall biosynthesis
MKICFHIPMFIFGGAESHIFELIRNLKRMGVDCCITYQFKEVAEHFESLQVPMFGVTSTEALKRRLEYLKPDVFQFFHCQLAYCALGQMQNRPKTVEIVHNRRHFQGDSTYYPKDQTDIVVAVSHDSAEYFRTRMSDIPVRTILNGIDRDKFCPPREKIKGRKRPLGGFSGRLESGDGKGIPSIIDAVKDLNVDFELVGHDYSDYYANYLKEKNIKNIRLVPHRTDIVAFYHLWDFFVSASPAEGFGLSIVEALACGLPSVLVNCGGAVRYLKPAEHAIIVDSPDELKKGIQRLLSERTKLNPRSADFCGAKMTENYLSLYTEMLAGSVQLPHVAVQVSPNTKMLLGTCPGDWAGIRNSLTNLCDAFVPYEGAIAEIKKTRPSCVVFGTYNEAWQPVVATAKKAGCKTVLTWHGTTVLGEFDSANRDSMISAIRAAKAGLFDLVGSPHEGVLSVFKQAGVLTEFIPNVIQDPPHYTAGPRSGMHLGVLGTGMPWKNRDTQLVAASMVQGATVHTQGGFQNDLMLVLPMLMGTQVQMHKHMDRDAFLRFISTLKINLCVGISETFSYLVAESLFVGTPVVASGTIPILENAPDILKKCIVAQLDNPEAIYKSIHHILVNYESVQRAGRAFIEEFNNKNKEVLSKVKAKLV